MTAHLNDSDRQALRLAQDLREEMRAALPQLPAPPSVSPFVDQAGMPSVLLRMDADTARALMAVLAEHRSGRSGGPPAEPRRADGSHVPLPAQAVPAAQGPVVAPGPPYGESAYGEPAYGEPPFIQAPQAAPMFTGGTGPTPLVPTAYPTH